MLKKLKRIWNDPVSSQVIAAAILATAGALYHWRRLRFSYALISALVLALIGICVRILVLKWRLRVKLTVSVEDSFPHVARLGVYIRNPGHRLVAINALEFVTKEHWDMPDPLREGYTVPVVNYLPPSLALIRISAEKEARASRAFGRILKPGDSFEDSFRLVTNHAPNYGIGLFPFYLGVTLMYGERKRLKLPDLIVSLHGSTTLTMTTHSREIPFMVEPGDRQTFANAVLSKIAEGAMCAPEILDILQREAHV